MERATIILGVIGSDCHAVGNQILDKVFTMAGFHVVNLGVMVTQSEFVGAALETQAQAILVSSLYGQAELDCPGLRDRCVEMGLHDILLYIGGRLVIGKQRFKPVMEKFEKMGFDRVFAPDCDLDEAVALLRQDIELRQG